MRYLYVLYLIVFIAVAGCNNRESGPALETQDPPEETYKPCLSIEESTAFGLFVAELQPSLKRFDLGTCGIFEVESAWLEYSAKKQVKTHPSSPYEVVNIVEKADNADLRICICLTRIKGEDGFSRKSFPARHSFPTYQDCLDGLCFDRPGLNPIYLIYGEIDSPNAKEHFFDKRIDRSKIKIAVICTDDNEIDAPANKEVKIEFKVKQ